jgi:hypothetical protein
MQIVEHKEKQHILAICTCALSRRHAHTPARDAGLLRTVATKMLISGGEIRKMVLMGDSGNEIKRGFPLFAQVVDTH